MKKIEISFNVLEENGVGYFVDASGCSLNDKTNDISAVMIDFDLNQNPIKANLSIDRYKEYTGGCYGYWVYAPECYGEFKKIKDGFLNKDPLYKKYDESTKLSVNTEESLLPPRDANKLIIDFLDTIFATFKLDEKGEAHFLNYCAGRGLNYQLPINDNDPEEGRSLGEQRGALGDLSIFSKTSPPIYEAVDSSKYTI